MTNCEKPSMLQDLNEPVNQEPGAGNCAMKQPSGKGRA